MGEHVTYEFRIEYRNGKQHQRQYALGENVHGQCSGHFFDESEMISKVQWWQGIVFWAQGLHCTCKYPYEFWYTFVASISHHVDDWHRFVDNSIHTHPADTSNRNSKWKMSHRMLRRWNFRSNFRSTIRLIGHGHHLTCDNEAAVRNCERNKYIMKIIARMWFIRDARYFHWQRQLPVFARSEYNVIQERNRYQCNGSHHIRANQQFIHNSVNWKAKIKMIPFDRTERTRLFANIDSKYPIRIVPCGDLMLHRWFCVGIGWIFARSGKS